MDASQRELYARIVAFRFDEGKPELTFAARLARENGWPQDYAHRVIGEYRRFMFLAVTAGHPVTPSDQVDQVWHLHLIYSRSYWERFCPEVLQTSLHHGPTQGGDAEGKKYDDWYGRTLASYRQFFDEEPPQEIWPAAEIRFGDDLHWERANTRHNWIVSKWQFKQFALQGLCVLAIVAWTVGVIVALLRSG